jgi:hypothetical protein
MTVTVRHGDLGTAGTAITGAVRLPSAPGDAIQAPVWSLIEGGEKGSTTLSGFALEDPSAAATLVGQKEVHFEDDACVEPTIFAGFFDQRSIGRAGALRTGAEREWDAQVTDLNVLLGDYAILSGSRPAETDIERIDWLLGSGYLPIGDAGYIDRSAPVSMPATDYTGRFAADVLAECSNESGKNYFVRWEQDCSWTDPTSPWYGTVTTTYVAPSGPSHPSSQDIFGGYWVAAGMGYYSADSGVGYPAQAVYPSTGASTQSGWCSTSYPWPPSPAAVSYTANDNGGGLGIGTTLSNGPAVVDARQVWDLLPLGIPSIAVCGLWSGGGSGGDDYGTFSIEHSDDGINWTAVFSSTYSGSPDPAALLPPLTLANLERHRYWSAHIVGGRTGGLGATYLGAHGLELWSGELRGPGPALGYHDTNWAGDTSGLAVSNVLADIDNVTTFGPKPTDKLPRNPSRVYSGCWFDYSGGHVYETYSATLAAFRHRDVRASDMTCTTAYTATLLALAYLARCTTEEDRITVNLENVPAASVNLARPGQRIPIKLSHVPGYESGTYLAIMQRTVTPVAYGSYDMTLDLAEPKLTGYFPARSLTPAVWQNVGQVISPAPSDVTTAIVGQRVAPTWIADGDGSTVLFTLPTGYMPGSLLMWIDAQPISAASITETDPAAGTLTLDFAPADAVGAIAAQALDASWQVP